MGNNSSKWDREAHYRSKTTKELEQLRDWWLQRLKDHDCTTGREELEYIRARLAERIGKRR